MMLDNVEDLEDFQNKSRYSVAGPKPIVRCFEVNNEKQTVKATGQVGSLLQHNDPSKKLHELSPPLREDVVYAENIDRNVDYQGWLELKKRKWRDNLEWRKRQR